MKIAYWSDYACPYCFIGVTNLRRALRELGLEGTVPVRRMAYELDPAADRACTMTALERHRKKYRLSEAEALDRIEEIDRMGAETGLTLRFGETRYTNTLDAHRLVKLAEETLGLPAADRLSERFYRTFFEGKELSDRETLRAAAAEAGLDPAETEAVLDSDRFEFEVRMDERRAERSGVRSVPFFVFNDRFAVPGALPPAGMKALLEDLLAEEGPAEPPAAACGPDGCGTGED